MNFSFIIPIFNEENYIAKCLDSIVSEMKEGDEIIVVDNGSTDRSIEIALSYDVSILFKPDKTIGSIRNDGAFIANKELIAFIDADCIICKGWRERVIEDLKNDKIIACGSKYKIPINASWIEKVWFSQRSNKKSFAKYLNAGNFVIRKNIFEENSGFNDQIITGEDAELCLRLRNLGYLILEDPEICCIHLGNPNNLLEFYKKQRWQGLGMLGTFKIYLFDKPLIMTIIFFLSIILSIGITFLYSGYSIIFFNIIIILFVPILAAIFRVLQYKNYNYFLELVFLYLIYFSARSNSIIIIFYNYIQRLLME